MNPRFQTFAALRCKVLHHNTELGVFDLAVPPDAPVQPVEGAPRFTIARPLRVVRHTEVAVRDGLDERQ